MEQTRHVEKVEANRSVIITLSPVQAQTLIQTLRQRVDTLRHESERAVRPGEKGKLLIAVNAAEALEQISIQAYNAWIGEETSGPHPIGG